MEITALAAGDRAAWEVLARGYKTFYRQALSDADYAAAWQRVIAGQAVHGLGARHEGRLVGITHYLFHAHTWEGEVCYLQDLFVLPEMRGRGAARALILAVADAAAARGVRRVYWQTHETNATARLLYDQVAKYNGFIRYDRLRGEP